MVKKFVITGGPCSGKTATINHLKKQGFFVFKEAAREVLKTKFKKRHSKEINRDVFQREIFKLQEKHLKEACNSNKKIVFFDRGFGDTLAYYLFAGSDIPKDLLGKAKKTKYTKVFFLEPLNFYKKDDIRQENENEQKKIAEFIIKVYSMLGYDIIKVPFMKIEQRAEFIKKFI